MTAWTMSQSTPNLLVPSVEKDTPGVDDRVGGHEVVQCNVKSGEVSFPSPLLPDASITSLSHVATSKHLEATEGSRGTQTPTQTDLDIVGV